jgi:hypothetical protein
MILLKKIIDYYEQKELIIGGSKLIYLILNCKFLIKKSLNLIK